MNQKQILKGIVKRTEEVDKLCEWDKEPFISNQYSYIDDAGKMAKDLFNYMMGPDVIKAFQKEADRRKALDK